MAKSVLLEVITPSKLFYKGEVEIIMVRTASGEEGFMAGHTWACKLLDDAGILWIKEAGAADYKAASVSTGYIDVRDHITVYTDSAEWFEDIDVERAKKTKEDIKQWLDTHDDSNSTAGERKEAEKAVARQNSRIHLVEIGGKRKK